MLIVARIGSLTLDTFIYLLRFCSWK